MLNTSGVKPANYHTMSSGNIVEALIRKTLLDDAIPNHTESTLNRAKTVNRRKTSRLTRSSKEGGSDHAKLKRDRGRGSKGKSLNGNMNVPDESSAPTMKRFKKAEQSSTEIIETPLRNGTLDCTTRLENGTENTTIKQSGDLSDATNKALGSTGNECSKEAKEISLDDSSLCDSGKENTTARENRKEKCNLPETQPVYIPKNSALGTAPKNTTCETSNARQPLTDNRTVSVISKCNGKVKTVGMTISNMIEQTLDLVVSSALKSDDEETSTKPESTSLIAGNEETADKSIRGNDEEKTENATIEERKVAKVSSTTDCNTSTNSTDKLQEQNRNIPHVGPKKKVLALLNQFSMEQILSSSAPPPANKEHPKKSLLWRAVEECAASSKVSSTNEPVSRSNVAKLSCSVSCSSSPGLEIPLSSPDNSPANSGASDTGAISPTEGASSTSNGSKDKKKKRKRCGICAPCLTKQNCGECSSCKNRRTGHQICKQRKCIELRKKLTDPCQSLQTAPTIPADGVTKMKQASGMPNAIFVPLDVSKNMYTGVTGGGNMDLNEFMAVAGNAPLSGFPPGLMQNLSKLHPAASIPDKSWVLQAAQPINGYLPHFNNLSPHMKMEGPTHIKREVPRIKTDTPPHVQRVKPPEKVHPELGRHPMEGRTILDGRPTTDGRPSSVDCRSNIEGGKSLEHRQINLGGFTDLEQLKQYWSHAAQRVPSPHSEKQIMLHHHRISGNGMPPKDDRHHLPPSQYSPHPKTPCGNIPTSIHSETKNNSSHHHNLHRNNSPHPPRVSRESYSSPHPSPHQSPHSSPHLPTQHLPSHLPPQPQRVSGETYPHSSGVPQESYSPVDLAAESLLSLSGSVPRKGFSFPSHNKEGIQETSRQGKKDLNSQKSQVSQSLTSPFTKVSQINKLTTPEGYALLSNPAHRGPSTLASRQPTPGLQPGDKITTPSPKVHVLPTYMPGRHEAGSSYSAIPRHILNSEAPSPGETPPGYKTPERVADSPSAKVTPMTPEEEAEKRLEMLSKNEKMEAPKCNCLEHDLDEAPYYTHLGTGPSVPAIRKLMEERFGQSGNCIRIEKLVYSGKEGKSSQGCPIAKWIIRRSSEEEKILTLVRNRPGHHCETAYIIIAIVAWEGVDRKDSDYLYDLLRTTLPLRAIPTIRKCATNEEKTCACQGFDPDTCGASFSFGCSWSMYYNACKFARSKTPRKFKLLDSDPQGEETLEAHFQHLAGEVGPLYKKLAPESYSNQVAFEEHAKDCRLGHAEGRPFSGVTACMDFCAHAHRDQQNMNNGSTVVVTLTKESIRSLRPPPGDEQLHILPLYYLDSTDEYGSSEGQQEKVRNGSLEVLTAYRHKSRLRQKPVIPKGAVRSRSSSNHDKSSPAKASKTVANLLASKSSASNSSEEKKKGASASASQPVSCQNDLQSENTRELKKSNRSAFASPKESNSPWPPPIKQEFPHSIDPSGRPGWPNGATAAYLQGRSVYPMHPEGMNGLRAESMLNSIPQEYMPLYPGLSPYLPPGYPAAMALNGMMTPEQLQANPHLFPQYAAAAAMDPSAYLNPFMRLPQYPHHPMDHVDIKPDPQQLNEMMRQNFGKAFGMQMGPGRDGSTGEPEQKYSRTLEHTQLLNGTYHHKTAAGYPPSNSQDAIWRPPIFHKEESSRTATPIDAMEQSVNALPTQQVKREDSTNNKHIPSGPRFGQTTPLKVEDPNRPQGSPEPLEEEYFSDSERCFEDPTIGGVAIGLSHGSVLFEVAKRELHATSSLQTPCRQKPTRISLVFYQHKQLNHKHHGIEFYEKKIEAKRQLMMEEGKLPPPKKKRPADDSKTSSKEQKKEKTGTPTRQAVTPHTYTVVTVASYAPTKVTGPYQSPPGKAAQQSSKSPGSAKKALKETPASSDR